MARRTTIDVDDELLADAQAVLGTRGLKDTFDAALREVVRHHRLQKLVDILEQGTHLDYELLSEEGRQRMWRG